MRRLWTAGGTAVAVAGLMVSLSVAASGTTPGKWVVRDLGTLGGVESTARGINERGQVVGRSEIKTGASRAYLWQRGKMTDLGTLGGRSSEAYAINDDGVVVGSSDTRSREVVHAFRWQHGRMIDLGTLGGRRSWAFAINSRGAIVGASETGVGGGVHAFLWRDGRMLDLGTLGGANSIATGISDRDHVVGTSETTRQGPLRGFLWRNGAMRDLGTALEDRWEASNTERWWVAAQTECARGLCGISNRDEIIGTRFARGFRRGYVWRAGKPTDLTTSGLDYAVPSAVNDRGEIVGLTMEIGTQEATLWRGKSATFLPNLDRPSIEWAYARAINEQRQIVGENQGEYGRLGLATHAVLWTWQPAK